jgi:predicted Fe-Mo cluster-binding NifX family protein
VSKPVPVDEPRPGLSKPAQRALAAAGIARLEQLTEYREADLLALHGMGPQAIETLRHALATRGMSFASDSEAAP